MAAFLLQDLAWAGAEIKPLAWDEDRGHKAWARKFLPPIPESIALLGDAWKAPQGERTLILVQDAHTNTSGQVNLAKTLDLLFSFRGHQAGNPLRNEGMKYVFLEAGSGDESLSFLRQYASLEKRRRVAESYLRKGELQGSEYLDLTSGHEIVLWGVEDMALYGKALELYRETARSRGKFEEYLGRVERTAKVLKPRIYNPLLLEFDEQLQKNKKEKAPLTEHFEFLTERARNLEIPLSSFPHLKSFHKLRTLEGRIDFKKAAEEQREAIQSLSAEAQKDLLEKQDPGRLASDGKIQTAYFDRLSEKLSSPRFRKSYSELSKYFRYLKASKKIDPKKLIEEQKVLENRIYAVLGANEDERFLIQACENIRSLKKLLHLQFTPEDFKQYQENKKSCDIARITGFLNRKIMDLKQFYEDAAFLEGGYEESIRKCAEFYELTYARDRKFIENLKTKADWRTAALVAGGYHAPNLKHLLRKENISYIVLTPQILHETNQDRYEKLLLSQKLPPASAGMSASAHALMLGRMAKDALGNRDVFAMDVAGKKWPQLQATAGARLAADRRNYSVSGQEGRVNENLWALVSEKDRKAVWGLLAQSRQGDKNERSYHFALKKPFRFAGDRYSTIQIKGFYAEKAASALPHEGLGRAPMDLFGPHAPSPQNGMTAAHARAEFENTNKLLQAAPEHSRLRVKLPLGWGTFPDIRFRGEPLGFVMLAVPDFMAKRWDETHFSTARTLRGAHAAGRALRWMHEAGMGHGFFHPGNMSWDPKGGILGLFGAMPAFGIHDLDNAFSIAEKAGAAKGQAVRVMIADMLYAMFKLDHVPLKVRDTRKFIEASQHILKAFVEGYFSAHPDPNARAEAVRRFRDFYLGLIDYLDGGSQGYAPTQAVTERLSIREIYDAYAAERGEDLILTGLFSGARLAAESEDEMIALFEKALGYTFKNKGRPRSILFPQEFFRINRTARLAGDYFFKFLMIDHQRQHLPGIGNTDLHRFINEAQSQARKNQMLKWHGMAQHAYGRYRALTDWQPYNVENFFTTLLGYVLFDEGDLDGKIDVGRRFLKNYFDETAKFLKIQPAPDKNEPADLPDYPAYLSDIRRAAKLIGPYLVDGKDAETELKSRLRKKASRPKRFALDFGHYDEWGDAVLDLVTIAQLIRRRGPDAEHDGIKEQQVAVTQNRTLAKLMAVSRGRGLMSIGRRDYESAFFEALVGVIYDVHAGGSGRGLEAASRFVVASHHEIDQHALDAAVKAERSAAELVLRGQPVGALPYLSRAAALYDSVIFTDDVAGLDMKKAVVFKKMAEALARQAHFVFASQTRRYASAESLLEKASNHIEKAVEIHLRHSTDPAHRNALSAASAVGDDIDGFRREVTAERISEGDGARLAVSDRFSRDLKFAMLSLETASLVEPSEDRRNRITRARNHLHRYVEDKGRYRNFDLARNELPGLIGVSEEMSSHASVRHLRSAQEIMRLSLTGQKVDPGILADVLLQAIHKKYMPAERTWHSGSSPALDHLEAALLTYLQHGGKSEKYQRKLIEELTSIREEDVRPLYVDLSQETPRNEAALFMVADLIGFMHGLQHQLLASQWPSMDEYDSDVLARISLGELDREDLTEALLREWEARYKTKAVPIAVMLLLAGVAASAARPRSVPSPSGKAAAKALASIFGNLFVHEQNNFLGYLYYKGRQKNAGAYAFAAHYLEPLMGSDGTNFIVYPPLEEEGDAAAATEGARLSERKGSSYPGDKAFAALLRRFQAHLSNIGRALKVSHPEVVYLIKTHGFKGLAQRIRKRRKDDYPGDRVFEAALRKHKAHRGLVAKELGISTGKVSKWIARRGFKSLAVRLQMERISRYPGNEKFRKLLEKHHGNLTRIAEELKVKQGTVSHWVGKHRFMTLLRKLKGRMNIVGRPSSYPGNKEFKALLKRYRAALGPIAKRLNVLTGTVDAWISRHHFKGFAETLRNGGSVRREGRGARLAQGRSDLRVMVGHLLAGHRRLSNKQLDALLTQTPLDLSLVRQITNRSLSEEQERAVLSMVRVAKSYLDTNAAASALFPDGVRQKTEQLVEEFLSLESRLAQEFSDALRPLQGQAPEPDRVRALLDARTDAFFDIIRAMKANVSERTILTGDLARFISFNKIDAPDSSLCAPIQKAVETAFRRNGFSPDSLDLETESGQLVHTSTFLPSGAGPSRSIAVDPAIGQYFREYSGKVLVTAFDDYERRFASKIGSVIAQRADSADRAKILVKLEQEFARRREEALRALSGARLAQRLIVTKADLDKIRSGYVYPRGGKLLHRSNWGRVLELPDAATPLVIKQPQSPIALEERIAKWIFDHEVSAARAIRSLGEERADGFYGPRNLLAGFEYHPEDRGRRGVIMPRLTGENARSRFHSGAEYQGAATPPHNKRFESVLHYLETARAMAEATALFNGLGWVHGDLKPGNFFVEGPRNGRQQEIILYDFDTARRVGESTPSYEGGKKLIMGTDGFMSSEQAAGFEASFQDDVYGLAATLAWLWSGHLLYAAYEGTNMEGRRIQAKNANTFAIWPDFEKALEDNPLREVILSGLGKPQMRSYARVSDMMPEIQAAIDRQAGARLAEAETIEAFREAFSGLSAEDLDFIDVDPARIALYRTERTNDPNDRHGYERFVHRHTVVMQDADGARRERVFYTKRYELQRRGPLAALRGFVDRLYRDWRFTREFRRLSLAHRHQLAPAARVAVLNGEKVLLMTPAAGRELGLEALAYLKAEQRLRFGFALGRALGRLHREAKIVHGDLTFRGEFKSDNTFWTENRRTGEITVQFIDFHALKPRNFIFGGSQSEMNAVRAALEEEAVEREFDSGYAGARLAVVPQEGTITFAHSEREKEKWEERFLNGSGLREHFRQKGFFEFIPTLSARATPLRWQGPDGKWFSALVKVHTGSWLFPEETALVLYPALREFIAQPSLLKLFLIPHVDLLPPVGSIGRVIVEQANLSDKRALFVQELQASAGFHALPEDLKIKYGDWQRALLKHIARTAFETGYSALYAHSDQSLRLLSKLLWLRESAVFWNYVRPFKKWWKRVAIEAAEKDQSKGLLSLGEREYHHLPLTKEEMARAEGIAPRVLSGARLAEMIPYEKAAEVLAPLVKQAKEADHPYDSKGERRKKEVLIVLRLGEDGELLTYGVLPRRPGPNAPEERHQYLADRLGIGKDFVRILIYFSSDETRPPDIHVDVTTRKPRPARQEVVRVLKLMHETFSLSYPEYAEKSRVVFDDKFFHAAELARIGIEGNVRAAYLGDAALLPEKPASLPKHRRYKISLAKEGPEIWRAGVFAFKIAPLAQTTLFQKGEAVNLFRTVETSLTEERAKTRLLQDAPASGFQTILALDGEHVAGLLHFHPAQKFLDLIVVDPRYRGVGIADILLEEFAARSLGGDRSQKFHSLIRGPSRDLREGTFYGTMDQFKRRLGIRSIVVPDQGARLAAFKEPSKTRDGRTVHQSESGVLLIGFEKIAEDQFRSNVGPQAYLVKVRSMERHDIDLGKNLYPYEDASLEIEGTKADPGLLDGLVKKVQSLEALPDGSLILTQFNANGAFVARHTIRPSGEIIRQHRLLSEGVDALRALKKAKAKGMPYLTIRQTLYYTTVIYKGRVLLRGEFFSPRPRVMVCRGRIEGDALMFAGTAGEWIEVDQEGTFSIHSGARLAASADESASGGLAEPAASEGIDGQAWRFAQAIERHEDALEEVLVKALSVLDAKALTVAAVAEQFKMIEDEVMRVLEEWTATEKALMLFLKDRAAYEFLGGDGTAIHRICAGATAVLGRAARRTGLPFAVETLLENGWGVHHFGALGLEGGLVAVDLTASQFEGPASRRIAVAPLREHQKWLEEARGRRGARLAENDYEIIMNRRKEILHFAKKLLAKSENQSWWKWVSHGRHFRQVIARLCGFKSMASQHIVRNGIVPVDQSAVTVREPWGGTLTVKGPILFPAIGDLIATGFIDQRVREKLRFQSDHYIFNDTAYEVRNSQVYYRGIEGEKEIFLNMMRRYDFFRGAKNSVIEHKKGKDMEWITYLLTFADGNEKKVTFVAGDIMEVDFSQLGIPSIGMIYATNLGWSNQLSGHATFWLRMRDILSDDGTLYLANGPIRFIDYTPYPGYYGVEDIYTLFYRKDLSGDYYYEVDKSKDIELSEHSSEEGQILAYLRDAESITKIIENKLTLDDIALNYLLTDQNIDGLRLVLKRSASEGDQALVLSFIRAYVQRVPERKLLASEVRRLKALVEMEAQIYRNRLKSSGARLAKAFDAAAFKHQWESRRVELTVVIGPTINPKRLQLRGPLLETLEAAVETIRRDHPYAAGSIMKDASPKFYRVELTRFSPKGPPRERSGARLAEQARNTGKRLKEIRGILLLSQREYAEALDLALEELVRFEKLRGRVPEAIVRRAELLVQAQAGRRVRALREDLLMTQEEFAEALGVPLYRLREWEQGLRPVLSHEMRMAEQFFRAEAGKRLRFIRETLGMSQKEFAGEALGSGKTSTGSWESGLYAVPDGIMEKARAFYRAEAGKRLKKLREYAGMFQGELGKELGVVQAAVYHWEAGDNPVPPAILRRTVEITRRESAGRFMETRELLQMTQKEFGAALRPEHPVHALVISDWEKGTHPVPFSMMRKASEVYDTKSGKDARRVRGLLGMGQRELARSLGVVQGTVFQWETGGHAVPREMLGKIRKIYRSGSGGQFRALRGRSGLSQADFARALGVDENNLYNWENGLHPVPEPVLEKAGQFVRGIKRGKVIRGIRRDLGTSSDAFARALGISAGTLETIEKDRGKAALELFHKARSIYREYAGATLRTLRESLGIERKAFREALTLDGIPDSRYANWERGAAFVPSPVLQKAWQLYRTQAGPRLRFVRELLGLSQDRLGSLLGYPQVSIHNWERAKSHRIPLEVMTGVWELYAERAGERLRSLRLYAAKGQQEFAERLGVPKTTLGNWESGSAPVPLDILPKAEEKVIEILGAGARLAARPDKRKILSLVNEAKDAYIKAIESLPRGMAQESVPGKEGMARAFIVHSDLPFARDVEDPSTPFLFPMAFFLHLDELAKDIQAANPNWVNINLWLRVLGESAVAFESFIQEENENSFVTPSFENWSQYRLHALDGGNALKEAYGHTLRMLASDDRNLFFERDEPETPQMLQQAIWQTYGILNIYAEKIWAHDPAKKEWAKDYFLGAVIPDASFFGKAGLPERFVGAVVENVARPLERALKNVRDHSDTKGLLRGEYHILAHAHESGLRPLLEKISEQDQSEGYFSALSGPSTSLLRYQLKELDARFAEIISRLDKDAGEESFGARLAATQEGEHANYKYGNAISLTLHLLGHFRDGVPGPAGIGLSRLVAWQLDHSQNGGERLNGRANAPVEIIIGHLDDNRFYVKNHRSILRFFASFKEAHPPVFTRILGLLKRVSVEADTPRHRRRAAVLHEKLSRLSDSRPALSAGAMERILNARARDVKEIAHFKDMLVSTRNRRALGDMLVEMKGQKILEIGPGPHMVLIKFLIHELGFDPQNVYAIDPLLADHKGPLTADHVLARKIEDGLREWRHLEFSRIMAFHVFSPAINKDHGRTFRAIRAALAASGIFSLMPVSDEFARTHLQPVFGRAIGRSLSADVSAYAEFKRNRFGAFGTPAVQITDTPYSFRKDGSVGARLAAAPSAALDAGLQELGALAASQARPSMTREWHDLQARRSPEHLRRVVRSNDIVYALLERQGFFENQTVIYPAGGIDAVVSYFAPTLLINHRGPRIHENERGSIAGELIRAATPYDPQAMDLRYIYGDAADPLNLRRAVEEVETGQTSVLIKGLTEYPFALHHFGGDEEAQKRAYESFLELYVRELNPHQFIVLNDRDAVRVRDYFAKRKGYEEIKDWLPEEAMDSLRESLKRLAESGSDGFFKEVRVHEPTDLAIFRRADKEKAIAGARLAEGTLELTEAQLLRKKMDVHLKAEPIRRAVERLFLEIALNLHKTDPEKHLALLLGPYNEAPITFSMHVNKEEGRLDIKIPDLEEPILMIEGDLRKKLEVLKHEPEPPPHPEGVPPPVQTLLNLSKIRMDLALEGVAAGRHPVAHAIPMTAFGDDPEDVQLKLLIVQLAGVHRIEARRRDRFYLEGLDREKTYRARALIEKHHAGKYILFSKPEEDAAMEGIIVRYVKTDGLKALPSRDDRSLLFPIAGLEEDALLSWFEAIPTAGALADAYGIGYDPAGRKIDLSQVSLERLDPKVVRVCLEKMLNKKLDPAGLKAVIEGRVDLEAFTKAGFWMPIARKVPLRELIRGARLAMRALGAAA